MMQHEKIDENLFKILKIVDFHDCDFAKPQLDHLRETMREIMSDGSHDCSDSLLGVKR